MRVLTVPLALLAAAWFAATPLAQCPEPSDLDIEPLAQPLLVTKGDGDLLRVTWESVLADGYRLHRGRLDHLVEERSYDHRVVAESVALLAARRDPGSTPPDPARCHALGVQRNTTVRATRRDEVRASTAAPRAWGTADGMQDALLYSSPWSQKGR